MPIWIRETVRRTLPQSALARLREVRKRLRRWQKRRRRKVGIVRFGSFRSVDPIRPVFGCGWGQGIDRYYVEGFLARNAGDIRGTVLEACDSNYTRRFGGDRVSRIEVLHPTPDNPQATLIGDLAGAAHLPSDTFDCIVLTQVLQYVFDLPAAVNTLHRMLKDGGVLLLTVPGISQISPADRQQFGEHWRFTTSSVERLLVGPFRPERVSVAAQGNVLSAVSLLEGLVVEELTAEELDYFDPLYEVSICARAVKVSLNESVQ